MKGHTLEVQNHHSLKSEQKNTTGILLGKDEIRGKILLLEALSYARA